MSTIENRIKISKTMAYALRHNPEEFSFVMLEGGWVELESFTKAISERKKDPTITVEVIEEIVKQDSKQRYVISEGRIRASQGHSTNIELNIPVSAPPEFLYHGTVTRFLPSILEAGLIPGERHHVHMSENVFVAETVAARHGKGIVTLRIEAQEAEAAGVVFMRSENGVWLAKHVPATFLSVFEK
jgi:putative RNA 2'-phosphotransferase